MSFWSRAFVALFGIVFLISTGPSAYRNVESWIESATRGQRSDEVTSPERAKELAAKGLREQLISFNGGLDSIDQSRNELFAIGVSQSTLGKPEAIPDKKIEDLTNELPQVFASQDTTSSPIYGAFNNIVVYDKKKNAFLTLFDTRVAISKFEIVGWTLRPVLAAFAAEKDMNGDGSLGSGDMEVLYVFTVDDKTLHRIRLEHLHADEVVAVPDADFLLVRYRVDRDRNGKLDSDEPSTLMRIDLRTLVATPFVPADVASNLQRILEGQAPTKAP